jgi:hypothetical protein
MKLRYAFALACAVGVLATGFFLGRNIAPFGVSAGPAGSNSLDVASGGVTAEAYQSAFDAYVQCARDAGMVVVGEVHQSRFGRLSVQLTSPDASGPSAAAGLHTSHEACRQQHLNDAELAWVLAHPPTEEESDAARQLTAECLVNRGIETPPVLNRSTMATLIAEQLTSADAETRRTVGTCLNDTAETMNWPGYGGS